MLRITTEDRIAYYVGCCDLSRAIRVRPPRRVDADGKVMIYVQFPTWGAAITATEARALANDLQLAAEDAELIGGRRCRTSSA